MSADQRAAARTLPGGRARERAPGWGGMLCLIATEASLFAHLIFSYFFLRTAATAWPPAGPPELGLVSMNTLILLASSGSMAWAARAIRAGRQRRLRLGLAITFALGALFLTLQGVEYRRLGFTPQTDAYGSLFFTITGFHGAHVFLGLLMLGWTQLRAWRGYCDAEHHLAVENTALYWHFVDAVWLVVFASLYLSPHL